MAKSSALVADLPDDMSPEALERLYAWGKSSCEEFDVHMNANGTMALVVVRKKPGTARDHQRNLRTLLQKWAVSLPQRQSGWLRIIDETDASSVEQAPATTSDPSGDESSPVPAGAADALRPKLKTTDRAPPITAPTATPATTRASAAVSIHGPRMALRPPLNLLGTRTVCAPSVEAFEPPAGAKLLRAHDSYIATKKDIAPSRKKKTL